jgi:hypothetical protein
MELSRPNGHINIYKDTMDVVERGHTSLQKVAMYWNILLTSTFTNIGAIGIVTSACFSCFSVKKILILHFSFMHFDDNVFNILWKHV